MWWGRAEQDRMDRLDLIGHNAVDWINKLDRQDRLDR